MRYQPAVSLLLAFLLSLSLIFPMAVAADAATVWEIGLADNSAAEFAYAPGDYTQVTGDAFYVVGWSDPAKDWPYVQPGIVDEWAGSKAHFFSVLFRLGAAPAEGEAKLVLDLLDTHPSRAPYLKVKVNGTESEKGTARGSGNEDALSGKPGAGKEYKHEVVFPANLLKVGDNVIEIKNHAGSWLVYDNVSLQANGATLEPITKPQPLVGELQAPPILVRQRGKQLQILRLPVRLFESSANASVRVGDAPPRQFTLEPGLRVLDLPVPVVSEPAHLVCTIEIEGQAPITREADVRPVRPWVVYLLHHTHLDIGYTHVQTEVEQVQWRHLEQAIDLAEKTRRYPEGARFKWLPEGLWAVDSYLAQATPEKRERFAKALKSGAISLDAFYGNELTALCRPEELIQLMAKARQVEKEFGVMIDSAMITDVPGYTWGIVTAMAQSGIKYWSIGPNNGHRIGYTLADWGDKPFYWVSPSGKERVLCWVAGKAYSWFHRGPLTEEDRIFEYLVSLDQAQYPYDQVHVRYNIGGDNGGPDPNICDYVKAWNARYAYPRLELATPSEMFRDFEAANRDKIPEVHGDFTPYWEDGAASTALETNLNREAAERLVQAQILFALNQPAQFPAEQFTQAWRNVLLYDEHTWGAHNSISEPEVDFVHQQWAIKRAFAVDAEQQSRALLDEAVAPFRKQDGAVGSVAVFNTQTWPRTDLVIVPKEWQLAGNAVQDAAGNLVPSQGLSDGSLAFLAKDVPPLGAAKFTFGAAAGGPAAGALSVADGELSNEFVHVVLDPLTGNITSLKGADGAECVNTKDGLALNQYVYVKGRYPDAKEFSGPATLRIKEPGPLVGSIVVESPAPGCKLLTREIRVVAGMDRVEIIDTLDRENVYEAEGVHLAFPFDVPEGVVRMETPFAVVRPDADQIEGSCKNYFTVQRWVDVSNGTRGVTLATIDAPMIEVGAIVNDARQKETLTRAGIEPGPGQIESFLRKTPPGTTLYSYVMNNYWETNYKASQPGPTTFRYALQPHAAYDQGAVQRFGLERSQPLIAVPGDAALGAGKGWPNANVLVTNIVPLEGGGLEWYCFNASDQPQTLEQPKDLGEGAWKVTNLRGETVEPVRWPLTFAPLELVVLRGE
ncbi:MAG: hypothetical protein HYV26_20730 [Candidatus Hydrogenedentes bacterium]|nr:hypothetical protein [Candidatus Hydrogenedentota bacterium]